MANAATLLLLLTASAARADDPVAVARRLVQGPSPPVHGPATPAVAVAVMDDLPPAALDQLAAARPELIPGLYGTLGDALARAAAEDAKRLGGYLAAVTRARSRRLAARDWTADDADLLLALQLVDLERFVGDAAFRRRVLAGLPHALDPRAPPALRDRLLYRLRQLRGVDFDAFEDVAWAWGALVRPSASRQLAGAAELRLGDPEAPIRASVFSLPSAFFTLADARRFLAAVRRAAPERTLLVLGDRPLGPALAADAELGVRHLETWGFPYSPWPRDPLTFLDDAGGGKVALLRPPSLRQGRPEDSSLGRALVQALPRGLDDAWRLRWRRAAFPFHNGQVLDAGGRLWISLHTLEIRILEILGLDRVPVERFAAADGARYLDAARQAAAELAELYGRETAFVHPLPAAADGPAARAAALAELGGGAGFDLDSLLTLLPAAGGLAALVADPGAGGELVDAAPAAELDRFAAAYGLAPRGETLRQRLRAAQASPRARRLAVFLDVVARHLAATAAVRRLPLLLVPRELQLSPGGAGRGGAGDPEFLVGWNNVVLERRADGPRAEGFASLLAGGDARARQVFAEHGYRLDLLPPLVESVVRNGGYRCASQHLR